MKKFVAVLLGLGMAALSADQITSFEQWKWNYPSGVGIWADKESKKPEPKMSEDAKDGKYSLQLEFFGCKNFQGVNLVGKKIPAGADAFTMYLKVIKGDPRYLDFQVEKRLEGEKDAENYAAQIPVAADGQWHQLVIPFDQLRYAWGKGSKKIEPNSILTLKILLHKDRSCVLAVDDVRYRVPVKK
ncbi:MAG: hypothetical protein PHS41_08550 [Victivallaceae bacterium]|nr:hypothetical protein [Victivallaceae bacterium]